MGGEQGWHSRYGQVVADAFEESATAAAVAAAAELAAAAVWFAAAGHCHA